MLLTITYNGKQTQNLGSIISDWSKVILQKTIFLPPPLKKAHYLTLGTKTADYLPT